MVGRKAESREGIVSGMDYDEVILLHGGEDNNETYSDVVPPSHVVDEAADLPQHRGCLYNSISQ